jgi:hypothetical protein
MKKFILSLGLILVLVTKSSAQAPHLNYTAIDAGYTNYFIFSAGISASSALPDTFLYIVQRVYTDSTVPFYQKTVLQNSTNVVDTLKNLVPGANYSLTVRITNPYGMFFYTGSAYTVYPLGITDQSVNSAKLWYTPAGKELKFSAIANELSDVSIYDLSGRPVHNQTIETDQGSVSLSLPSGIYIARLSQSSGVITRKILIE